MKIASAENLFSSNLIFRIQGTFIRIIHDVTTESQKIKMDGEKLCNVIGCPCGWMVRNVNNPAYKG